MVIVTAVRRLSVGIHTVQKSLTVAIVVVVFVVVAVEYYCFFMIIVGPLYLPDPVWGRKYKHLLKLNINTAAAS